MKILLVHNSYQQPGGEDVVFEQERCLLERSGHEVTIYRRSNWEIADYSAAKRLGLTAQMIWARDSRREIAQLLRLKKPDLAHVHNTFPVISPSIYASCAEAHVPVVQTLHNYRLLCPAAFFFRNGSVCEECLDHGLWRGVQHGCYRDSRAATSAVAVMLAVHRSLGTWTRGVRRFIALTEFSRRKFTEGGLPQTRIDVKPNFVLADPGRQQDRGNHAVFVGRFSPPKRIITLLDAWQRLPTSISLRIIGGGPERDVLEAYAARNRLSNVRFDGQLPHSDVMQAIKSARLLVFPSEWYENFPMTIAEAFACGIPVVCSRLGAMEEIVADGRTGLHFTPGDPYDLAQKVQWASDHPAEMDAMGRAARDEYEAKYTAETNYNTLLNIYHKALGIA